MTRVELAEHLRQHDKESIEAGGFDDGNWHYDDPGWWTDDELTDAHKGDHEEGVLIGENGERFYFPHTHEETV